jgi:hypothetical protein
MEPDLNFDFDSRFRETNSRGWSWPIRSIASLMVLIAVSSLSMTVMARGTRRQTGPATSVKMWRVPQKPVLTPKATPGVPAKVMPLPRTDRFVIEADADIDPKMVVKADPNIDPEMVFNPEARARRSLPIAPVLVPVPGNPNYPLFPKSPSGPGQINPNGRNQRPR